MLKTFSHNTKTRAVLTKYVLKIRRKIDSGGIKEFASFLKN